MNSNKKRVKLLISGRVQGVGFRASTRAKAKKLNLKGWVKNLKDGRVKIIAEGEEEKLKKIIQWAKEGPFPAKVTNLQKQFKDYKEEFKEFKIEH